MVCFGFPPRMMALMHTIMIWSIMNRHYFVGDIHLLTMHLIKDMVYLFAVFVVIFLQ